MPDQPTYLTETILTIQHEVQLALDYIETVAGQETSQLGAAPSLITVDNLRIRIPFTFEVEHKAEPIEAEKERPVAGARLSPEQLAILKDRLRLRQGLLLQTTEGQLGSFAKIRVASPAPPVSKLPSETEEAAPAPPLTGEIELNFIRIPRELSQTAPPPTATGKGGVGGSPVPDLIGLTLDEAVAQLKAAGWNFEPHAAGKEELGDASEERRGRVISQYPPPAQLVDKTKTTIGFGVALSNVPVKEIDGIGDKLGSRLAQIGLATVGQLSLGKAGEIAAALRMSESRAQGLIDMAGFMSRLTIMGLKDEVVELLVKGAGIRSVEQLAAANPAELHKQCREAVASAKVRVPRSFSFAIEDATE